MVWMNEIKADTSQEWISKFSERMRKTIKPLDETYKTHQEAVSYREGCEDMLNTLTIGYMGWHKTHYVDVLDEVLPICEPIETLGLATPTYNALKRAQIGRIYQIYKYSMDRGVRKIRNIGRAAIDDINTCLLNAGLPEINE